MTKEGYQIDKKVLAKALESLMNCNQFLLITKTGDLVGNFRCADDTHIAAALVAAMKQDEGLKDIVVEAKAILTKQEIDEAEAARF